MTDIVGAISSMPPQATIDIIGAIRHDTTRNRDPAIQRYLSAAEVYGLGYRSILRNYFDDIDAHWTCGDSVRHGLEFSFADIPCGWQEDKRGEFYLYGNTNESGRYSYGERYHPGPRYLGNPGRRIP